MCITVSTESRRSAVLFSGEPCAHAVVSDDYRSWDFASPADLVDNFNGAFSAVLFFTYGFLFLAGSTYCYGAAVPLVTSFSSTRAGFAVGNLFISVTLYLSMTLFCTLGQSLITESTHAKMAFEDLCRCHFCQMRNESRFAAHCLKDRLGSLRVSPFDAFELSHGSFLALCGSTLTYMIVLLQFMASTE